MTDQKIRIWDLPVRLFHWCLAILVATCIYTGETGGFTEMDYHMLSGYSILALLLFRVAWGFLGTPHARFAGFVRPTRILPYTRDLLAGRHETAAGHNPLGAMSAIALLLVIGIQAGTGLFANDDIFLEGPLAHLVEDETSDQLTGIHHLNSKVLYALIGLHLAAIAFYEFRMGERLTLAMITGHKTGVRADAQHPVRNFREVGLAAVILGITGAFVYWLINYV